MLAAVNQVLADQGANVAAQYLSTRGEQGYVVTDVVDPVSDEARRRLALRCAHTLRHTIWLRDLAGLAARLAGAGTMAG